MDSPDPGASADGRICASSWDAGRGDGLPETLAMGLQHVSVPGKTLPGLGSCRGARNVWAEPARHGTRAVRGGPDPKSRLLDPCWCPAVLCTWGREVTRGEPGQCRARRGQQGSPGKPKPWCSRRCFGTALAWVPGVPVVPRAVVPCARARLPRSVLQEGGCHARCRACSCNGRALDG